MHASPGWKMGSSKRDDVDKQRLRSANFPPPDTYNPNHTPVKERNASYSFGTGKRHDLGSGSKTPAPGTYPVPNKAIEGSKFSMGLKLDNQSSIGQEVKRQSMNPGAGTYNPDYKKIKNFHGAFSMQSRPKIKEEDKAPGPGAYAPVAAQKQRGPTFSFGSASQRQPLPPATAPGPGNYHIPCGIGNLPAYTGARPKDFGYI